MQKYCVSWCFSQVLIGFVNTLSGASGVRIHIVPMWVGDKMHKAIRTSVFIPSCEIFQLPWCLKKLKSWPLVQENGKKELATS